MDMTLAPRLSTLRDMAITFVWDVLPPPLVEIVPINNGMGMMVMVVIVLNDYAVEVDGAHGN